MFGLQELSGTAPLVSTGRVDRLVIRGYRAVITRVTKTLANPPALDVDLSATR
jgi:hypothetical protein